MSLPDYTATVDEDTHLKSYAIYANLAGNTLLLIISTKYKGRGGHWTETDRVTLTHKKRTKKQTQRALEKMMRLDEVFPDENVPYETNNQIHLQI